MLLAHARARRVRQATPGAGSGYVNHPVPRPPHPAATVGLANIDRPLVGDSNFRISSATSADRPLCVARSRPTGNWPVRAGRRRSPIADNSESKMDPTVLQQKTQRPVQFEISAATREAVEAWIRKAGLRPDACCSDPPNDEGTDAPARRSDPIFRAHPWCAFCAFLQL